MKKHSLYSERILSGNRSFYLDVRETQKGNQYLTLSCVSQKDGETASRNQIVIFESEIDRFSTSFMHSLLHFTRKQTTKEVRIEKARTKYARAYEPWSKKEDAELALLFTQGKSIDDMAQSLQRQPGAVKLRVDKLELVPVAA